MSIRTTDILRRNLLQEVKPILVLRILLDYTIAYQLIKEMARIARTIDSVLDTRNKRIGKICEFL